VLVFEKLLVWQKSIDYAVILIQIADTLPQRYQFSFSDQLRRAALSIPNNIHPDTAQLQHISLVNVDDLAKINDATLQKRQAEIPKALAIIHEFETEFYEWLESRKFVPIIKAVKKKLEDMNHCEMFNAVYAANHHNINTEEAVQKAVKNMAVKLRNNFNPGCNFIEAINDFITISNN
ncbi:MAG: four helix bundle protein, partial [Bacteroidota bacterium]|nr:four helix bundle protein [Bacteroidota bacterium]